MLIFILPDTSSGAFWWFCIFSLELHIKYLQKGGIVNTFSERGQTYIKTTSENPSGYMQKLFD